MAEIVMSRSCMIDIDNFICCNMLCKFESLKNGQIRQIYAFQT